MRAGADFYSSQGLLVNFYGHGSNSNYSSQVVTTPRMWSNNSVGICDWWALRSPVIVKLSCSQDGSTASVTATISNATDPDTAVEIVIPNWSAGAVGGLQVLLNGAPADPGDQRTTSNGVKVKVGNSTSTVEVHYEPVVITPTPVSSRHINIGETNILSGDDSGNANLLVAQQAVLAQVETIQRLSFYVTSTAGSCASASTMILAKIRERCGRRRPPLHL